MAIEQIRKIKEAENQADEARRKATLDAKQLQVDAEKEAVSIMESVNQEVHDLRKSKTAKADADANISYDLIINKAEKECLDIKNKASGNLEAAAKLIIGKVVG